MISFLLSIIGFMISIGVFIAITLAAIIFQCLVYTIAIIRWLYNFIINLKLKK